MGDTKETEKYFTGHLPRFLEQKKFIDSFVHLAPDSKVLDCGTWFPFVSWYMRYKFGADVSFTCLDLPDTGKFRTIFEIDQCHGFRSNLCFDDYGTETFDFIFLTECLEHLPCNLYPVRDGIIRALRPGGWLMVSYPLGVKGRNIQTCDYDKDLKLSFDKSYGHLREFTRETAEEFITTLPKIEHKEVWTDAYGGNILQMLYAKPKPITTESEIEQRG
jgi:SAM-dependent methyltransferase